MASLRCAVVLLFFLLSHLDLELVLGSPSMQLTYNISKCPSTRSEQCSSTKDLCQNDQECEVSFPGKGFKCCSVCGKSCVTPEVTVVKMTPVKLFKRLKPRTRLVAKCPTSPPSRESPPGPDQECQNDAICDNKYPGQDLKCCSDGDDFRCMAPVVESVSLLPEVGSCPAPSTKTPQECQGVYKRRSCSSDAECKRRYPMFRSYVRCCEKTCGGRECVIPIPIQRSQKIHGVCPSSRRPPECPPEPDNECEDDQNCGSLYPGQGLKCCKTGCDFICRTPITTGPRIRPCPIFLFPGPFFRHVNNKFLNC